METITDLGGGARSDLSVMTRPRVLLGDDHRRVLEGIAGLLEAEYDAVAGRPVR